MGKLALVVDELKLSAKFRVGHRPKLNMIDAFVRTRREETRAAGKSNRMLAAVNGGVEE